MATPWLSPQFIENVLRRSENDDSICVIDCSIKPATNKGDNYTSDMHRAYVEFRRSQSIKEVTEKKSIIIKVAPTNEGPHKEIAGLFEVEIKMMTTTLREMQLILKDTKLGGDCYYKQEANPPLLVIEDLAPLGFRMANRMAGLDLDHCMLAIRGLAKFHASSVAVCEKKPQYKDVYNKGIFNSDNPPDMAKFFTSSMRTLTNCVKTWPELGPEYYEKLDRLVEKAYGNASDSKKRDDSEFNVINHGDFWVNNMLFKYNDKGQVTDHIFVDFQLCVYGSPGVDLSYFFNTSLSETVLMNHKNDILNEYLNVLTATMKKIGCKTSPPSMNDLQKILRKTEPYGFVAACTILPLVLTKSDDAMDLEELMEQVDEEFNVKAYNNEVYRKVIVRRLIDWNAMGLLDK
ncbi:uncharacterized protein [Chelonus insularis]|uniref:uncharacterized protein isoform X2 n=1 Tax=Chelonus insularis TaxID=460826 RepID=UPI00158B57D4|nr:uncharacterized protein LOC118069355 isoform X2 [Chelonus insularis]